MLNRIILWSLRNRLVVITLAGLLMAFGIRAALEAPIDVFPEFAPPQVIIQTEAPGFSPEEVEKLVTLPLETSLNGTSNLNTIRSSSIAGLSLITCIFQAGTDIFLARQLVNEKLQLARSRLPEGAADPQMTPITMSVGIVMKISLTSATTSPMDLRTLADWTIRPRLLAVQGISQVTIFGGEVKQYQVLVDPAKLADYRVTLSEVMGAARRANQNAGAGFLDNAGQTMVIQGEGRVRSLADLESAVVAVKSGVPVQIGQVARVQFGPQYKVGDASTFGEASVLVIVLRQPWANTLTTTEGVDKALDELRQALPSDVVLDASIFRQADFIQSAISNIDWAMLQGGCLVALVLFFFLYNWRTGLISLAAIPLSLLVAIIALRLMGGTVNTMTLGGLAIAIGEVVDDAIIDVENVHRRLRENRLKQAPDSVLSVIYHASVEVRGSVVYATFIVALVFLPIFSLSGLAGRIFAPLGLAYIIAILASLLVALTVTPALCYFLLPNGAQRADETPTLRFLKRHYLRLLSPTLRHPRVVMAASAVLVLSAVATIPFLGGRFLPEFNEGNLIIHMAAVPGTSLEESMRVGAIVQRRLAEVPEVVKVAQQAGRAELSEDTIGSYYSELAVKLKRSERDQDDVLREIRMKLEAVKGFRFNIKQFISERIEEVLSGTTATVVVKVFGPDLDELARQAEAVQGDMASIPGVTDLNVEQQIGVPRVRIEFNRVSMGHYGINSADLAEITRAAFFGAPVSEVLDQQKTVAILVRYETTAASDLEAMRRTLIDTPTGAKIPLGAVAGIDIASGPDTINRESAQRRMVVSSNVAGRSLTGVVDEIRHRLAANVKLPTGYHIEYGGQYEAQSAARRQMTVLGAAAAIGILMLLFLAFRSIKESLLVMANLPLALVGGVAAVFMSSGGEISVASLIGFVSLFGIAARNGIMLITHYSHLMEKEGVPFGRELTIRGAAERLSPILMTALTAGLGLLPLAVGAGKSGRELEQPMAVVILGGLTTSTLLNMFVLPCLYLTVGKVKTRSTDEMLPREEYEIPQHRDPQLHQRERSS